MAPVKGRVFWHRIVAGVLGAIFVFFVVMFVVLAKRGNSDGTFASMVGVVLVAALGLVCMGRLKDGGARR